MEEKKKINKKQLGIIGGILVVIIAGIVVGKIYNENKYKKKLIETSKGMITLGGDLEKVTNNYTALWEGKINSNYTTSWTREYMAQYIGIDVNKFINNTTPLEYNRAYTFNDVLKCYNEFNSNSGVNKTLLNMLKIIEGDITDLNDCPNKFRKSYDSLVKMYTNLSTFVNLAVSPSGNLLSYKNEVRNLDNDIVSEYNVFKTQLPN